MEKKLDVKNVVVHHSYFSHENPFKIGTSSNHQRQGSDIDPISCKYDQPSFFFEDEYCV